MATINRRAKRLVMFNHKGGVGKTTLTVNLAHALADSGKRVLLVDTDPQCSLSSYFLEESYLDELLDDSEGDNGNTLWSALKPVSEGSGGLKSISPVKITDNLYVVVGDIRLSEFEGTLANAWNLCLERNRRGFICSAALSSLVDRLVTETNADFVFFDAGPNIGPLNRAVLLDCTHVVIPAACDLFSTRAIKTLGYALSGWVTTWERIREIAPEGTALLEGRVRLLGFVPQGFRTYRGEMAKAPFSRLAKLEDRVLEYVWKPLQLAYGLPTTERPSRLKIAQIRFFGGLTAIAQTQGQSLWEVSGGSAESKRNAHAEFSRMAKQVILQTA